MNTIAIALLTAKEKESKQPAWFAKADAKKKSLLNEPHFNVATTSVALRIKVYAELAFPNNTIYMTFRKDFIAVKVEKAFICDALTTYTDMLTELCELKHVSIHVIGDNLLFHIAKI